MVEKGFDNLKNLNHNVKTFSISILDREIKKSKKTKYIQLSFFNLDPDWRRDGQFSSRIPTNWTIPPSESKAVNLEKARQVMLKKQKITDKEIEWRGRIRKQAIILIDNNLKCGNELSEIRTYYQIHANDIVRSRPYEYYLDYAKSNNLEPISFQQWAKSTAQEIFINDLIPKTLWNNTPKNPKQ